MREPLENRRELLEQKVLPKVSEPVRYASSLDAALPVLVQSVKEQGFEGLVAKRRNSVYESGLRAGAWMKMRVNRGQEFVTIVELGSALPMRDNQCATIIRKVVIDADTGRHRPRGHRH